MPNQNKIYQVEDLTQKLKDAKSTALLQYQGLTAGQINQLRAEVKKQGGYIEVAKNTLIIRALQNIGVELPQKLTGPTALAFATQDEVTPLKEIDKVNKKLKLTEFKYAIYQQKLLAQDKLQQLLSLPSHTQLISQLIGNISNPLYRFAYDLKFHQTKLLLLLKALASKQPAN
ncbi:50S ribosomal protein L10 [Candidatus Shapirobacteria bacterium]|nr:MAG: 50S ribosomal protein L10 [Candidatus Shapirobacteria bacterium]